MSGEEENSGPSVGATAQSQVSQSTMFHQILPPQYLDLKTTGEIAENWKLWKEKYNNYFVISRLHRESPEYQLAMFKHAIGNDGLKVIKSFIKKFSHSFYIYQNPFVINIKTFLDLRLSFTLACTKINLKSHA